MEQLMKSRLIGEGGERSVGMQPRYGIFPGDVVRPWRAGMIEQLCHRRGIEQHRPSRNDTPDQAMDDTHTLTGLLP